MTAATPCPEPLEVLAVDPAVGLYALRYPSGSRENVTHDVVLLLTESGPAWQCYCEDATLGGEDACKHVVDARRRWVALGRHDWMRRPRIAYAFCRSCGGVRQADGHLDAAPCRRATLGPPRVTTRR